MKRITRLAPSPAMVVSCIALLVALGGVGYAATALPRNSVGTPQLKRNAVTSIKVKDRSLLARDFRRGQLPRGLRGLTGPAGPQGPQGAQGAQGIQGPPGPFTDTLPAGKSMRGTWTLVGYAAAAGEWVSDSISYNFPLAANVTPHFIAAGAALPAGCAGTVANPSASPGHLCIFAAYNDLGGQIGTPTLWDSAANGYRFGVMVYAQSASGGVIDTLGSWVVTAHNPAPVAAAPNAHNTDRATD